MLPGGFSMLCVLTSKRGFGAVTLFAAEIFFLSQIFGVDQMFADS